MPVEPIVPTKRSAARAALELPAHAVCFGYFGRLDPIGKADLTPLLRAFALAAGRTETILILCGDDRSHYGNSLAAIAEALGISGQVYVRSTGAALEPQVVYGALDVFVSPVDNLQESYGLTPIEAMSASLPCIVSDWNGYRESVLDGETGITVPTFVNWRGAVTRSFESVDTRYGQVACSSSTVVSVRHLANAIRRLIDEPSLRTHFGTAGQRRAMAIASPETYARGMVDQLRLAVDANSDYLQGPGVGRETPNAVAAFSQFPTGAVGPSLSIRCAEPDSGYLHALRAWGMISPTDIAAFATLDTVRTVREAEDRGVGDEVITRLAKYGILEMGDF